VNKIILRPQRRAGRLAELSAVGVSRDHADQLETRRKFYMCNWRVGGGVDLIVIVSPDIAFCFIICEILSVISVRPSTVYNYIFKSSLDI
jgi:hypothetical protein